MLHTQSHTHMDVYNHIQMIYIYICISFIYMFLAITWQLGACITSWLQLNWLMSWALAAGPILDLFREVRWWFAPGGCPFASVLLGAIVVSSVSFCAGVALTCCILSVRCRHWIWHCISGARHFWGDRGPLPESLVARERFREYRRA